MERGPITEFLVCGRGDKKNKNSGGKPEGKKGTWLMVPG
jgi:hypothetical protein